MRNNKEQKRGVLPVTKAAAVIAVIFLITEIAFMVFMLLTDIFPMKYFVLAVVLLVIAAAVILPLLCSQREATSKRGVGTALAVIMIIALGVGSFYLYSTLDMFNKISDEDKQSEDFHVVALKEGSYDKIENIKGERVFVSAIETETYSQARGELKEMAEVTYESCADYLALGYKLVDSKGDTHDNIIFLSDDNYNTLCDEIPDFEEKTKIIYTVNVQLQGGDIAKSVDVTGETFNIYISGIDTYGDISKVSRSDVNMIVTVNPSTKKILLTSIPRDMYVTLHSYGAKDKLTHSGNFGIEETVATVEDWLGIDINYYVRVNFTTLKDVVDAIGGIEVDSAQSFTTANGKYSFVAGSNYLDGDAALSFARERYAFASGDNERVKNQQRVLKGIINKISTDKSILLKYPQLLGTVKNQIQTNMTDDEISSLIKMQLGDMASWEIESVSVTGSGTMSTTYSMGNQLVYVMIPGESSVEYAKQAIREMN